MKLSTRPVTHCATTLLRNPLCFPIKLHSHVRKFVEEYFTNRLNSCKLHLMEWVLIFGERMKNRKGFKRLSGRTLRSFLIFASLCTSKQTFYFDTVKVEFKV
jgi:hypothetical protein